jgi:hypothetical protein
VRGGDAQDAGRGVRDAGRGGDEGAGPGGTPGHGGARAHRALLQSPRNVDLGEARGQAAQAGPVPAGHDRQRVGVHHALAPVGASVRDNVALLPDVLLPEVALLSWSFCCGGAAAARSGARLPHLVLLML